jgi:plasmid maintenance system antidote protein VapI
MAIPLEEQTPLQALLETKRIYTIKRFAEVTGLSTQHAWQLWHGKAKIGGRTALLIHDATGLSLEALLRLSYGEPSDRQPV